MVVSFLKKYGRITIFDIGLNMAFIKVTITIKCNEYGFNHGCVGVAEISKNLILQSISKSLTFFLDLDSNHIKNQNSISIERL